MVIVVEMVAKHENAPGSEWWNWNWRSKGDLMQSGPGAAHNYSGASSLSGRPSSLVGSMTVVASALNCKRVLLVDHLCDH
ncbi:hypothetical protein RJ641_007024 [Dillenia turbinata]|uniref:Uncharacterized protein n=1 Tax=Dillenia turbinata TaxID=194707 RepID=A0AAN8V4V7_9MAGN